MRRQPEEFSFHADKSTQHPGEEVRIEGRDEAVPNPLCEFSLRPVSHTYRGQKVLSRDNFLPMKQERAMWFSQFKDNHLLYQCIQQICASIRQTLK
jgi:hypothetical protein